MTYSNLHGWRYCAMCGSSCWAGRDATRLPLLDRPPLQGRQHLLPLPGASGCTVGPVCLSSSMLAAKGSLGDSANPW